MEQKKQRGRGKAKQKGIDTTVISQRIPSIVAKQLKEEINTFILNRLPEILPNPYGNKCKCEVVDYTPTGTPIIAKCKSCLYNEGRTVYGNNKPKEQPHKKRKRCKCKLINNRFIVRNGGNCTLSIEEHTPQWRSKWKR